MQFEDFFRTQKTIFELLTDRNYLVDDSLKIFEEQYEKIKEEDIELIFQKQNGTKILVVWHNQDVGVSLINRLYKRLSQENISNILIIKSGKLTPMANTTINELSSMHMIQVFGVEDIMNNPTTHSLVPKHELLTNKDANDIIEAYKIKKSQLLRIYTSDPIVRYYGWRRGNIIKITRNKGIVYRCIV